MIIRGDTDNLICISDLHCGCRVALCPPDGVKLDDGGIYMPSPLQLKIWSYWRFFWDEWVPMVTKGEPFDIVINGDTLDGVHHGATTQISQNLEDQSRIALKILPEIVDRAKRVFVTRGTEAHVGKSAVEEERLAERLGAIPNSEGQYARYELWARVGEALCHIMHHIGTTGSAAYESTAVHKELVESFTEAARHRLEPPDVIVRAHRHRYFKTSFAASVNGDSRDAIAVVSAGWQAKTPFAYKIPGGRVSLPQFGGILIKAGDEDPVYTRHQTWHLQRPEVV